MKQLTVKLAPERWQQLRLLGTKLVKTNITMVEEAVADLVALRLMRLDEIPIPEGARQVTVKADLTTWQEVRALGIRLGGITNQTVLTVALEDYLRKHGEL